MSNTAIDQKIFQHSEDIIFRQESDKVSVMNLLDNSLFEIDFIAAEVFLAFDGNKKTAQIRSSLLAKNKAPQKEFNKKFDLLIKDLLKNKLIEPKI